MAIDFFLHVIPGGTVGIGPQTLGAAHELITQRPNQNLANDWNMFNLAPCTCINGADVARGLVGWKAEFLVGVGSAGDSLSGVGIFSTINAGAHETTPHFPEMAGLFSGAITGVAASLFGYYFMETDVCITSATVVDPTKDFGFFVCPSWVSGSVTAHFGGTNGFGLCWAAGLPNDNYHLFIAVGDAGGNYFALVDTGIPALDAVTRLLRVEWGFDVTLAKPVIRGVIDDVIVAELIGPFVLDTAFELGAFSQGAMVGIDLSDLQPVTNGITAFFGMASGIRIGGFTVIPPTPPVPPVVTLTPCSVITPTFFNQTPGVIVAFQPCSGTGQPTSPGQIPCG